MVKSIISTFDAESGASGRGLESLEHNCRQCCRADLIALVGVCSGPTQGLHDVPLIPKRRNGRTILFRSNTSASTRGRSKDLSNRHLLHIQSEREDTAEHMGRLEEAVHDVDVPAARHKWKSA